jgi:chemotaxis protein CheD
MGEIGISRNGATLRTLLGSCVGVALYDRRLKLGALAHVVLPSANGKQDHPGKYADTAVAEMLRRLTELAGGSPVKPVAKIAGGANMFAASSDVATIGEQNIQAIEKVLEQAGITIVGRHLGGEQGRRMTFDGENGIVTIDVVGAETTVL